MPKAYVLTSDYYDGPSKIERVYLDKSRADEDFEILRDAGGRHFQLHETDIFGSPYVPWTPELIPPPAPSVTETPAVPVDPPLADEDCPL